MSTRTERREAAKAAKKARKKREKAARKEEPVQLSTSSQFKFNRSEFPSIVTVPHVKEKKVPFISFDQAIPDTQEHDFAKTLEVKVKLPVSIIEEARYSFCTTRLKVPTPLVIESMAQTEFIDNLKSELNQSEIDKIYETFYLNEEHSRYRREFDDGQYNFCINYIMERKKLLQG